MADPTYLEFFGLRRPPFARLSSPSELFHAEQYSLLMEHLVSAGRRADTCVFIRGADGSGKSTLLHTYLSGLGDDIHIAVFKETCGSKEQFFTEFLAQIGFTNITGSAEELRNITREFVVSRGNAGDHVLICVDNAHLVNQVILEQLRLISDIRVDGNRVTSVVLAGSPGLVRAVDASALGQVKFNSHVVFNIRNYSETETKNYVWHRLRLAGGLDGVKIPDEVYPLLQRYSGGIPRLINKLCNCVLKEACDTDSRVITEKIVRAVADKEQLLPHVINLHGKGRRRTDPDFKIAPGVPNTEERISLAETKTNGPVEEPASGSAEGASGNLLQQISRLSEQVTDLRADNVRALQEIDARDKHIGKLRDELNSKTSKIEILSHSLESNAGEYSHANQALTTATEALQESRKTAKKLNDQLEQELRRRESAEDKLAEATARFDELGQQNQELQATVDALRAEIKAADKRAVEFETLEKNSAELEGEIEEQQAELERLRDELTSRDHAVNDLEKELEASQQECELAQRQVLELTRPTEIEAVAKVSKQLAADLEYEAKLREIAEAELAEATARLDELDQQNQELQATVDALEIASAAANEQAVEIAALEKGSAKLKAEIEDQQVEMDALRTELASRDHALADLEQATRLRAAAEDGLAEAKTTIDELDQQNRELQAIVDALENEAKAADERAVEIEALEKNSAGLKGEIEEQQVEMDALRDALASRDHALTDLEKELESSQQELALAQRRILELKSPQELEKIESVSERLAADLEREIRQREAAEDGLAKAKEEIAELGRQNQELQATVHDINVDLEMAAERATRIDALENSVAALKDEIKKKSFELDSRNNALAEAKKQLAVKRQGRKSKKPRAKASISAEGNASGTVETVPATETPLRASFVVEKFEEKIYKVRAYRTLKEYDPVSYNHMIATYKRFVGLDRSDKQVEDVLRAERAEIIEKRLPKASDEAVISYARVIAEQLDEFLVAGTEPCFTLLISRPRRDRDELPVYSEKTKERELDVLELTLRTYDADKRPPTDKDVLADLEPILEELVEEYGEENVSALGKSRNANVDTGLMCTIGRSLYSRILELPRRNRANVLRWLFSP